MSRLRAKPVRTASGIAVVAVMSKPHRCPHIATTGNICVYCPGGPDSDFEYSTQSYTGCASENIIGAAVSTSPTLNVSADVLHKSSSTSAPLHVATSCLRGVRKAEGMCILSVDFGRRGPKACMTCLWT